MPYALAPPSKQQDAVRRFRALFSGREDAYGTGRGGVVRREPTDRIYEQHLTGAGSGLGIFPLRDDGTVRFGAIDFDEPSYDLAVSATRVIPGATWIERSRSGNYHVWALFSGDAPAWAVRALLRLAAEAVDRPRAEVFPKQDRLLPGMVGNYINLPFFGRDRPIVTNIPGESPEPIQFRGWLEVAERALNDPAGWARRAERIGAGPASSVERREQGTSASLHRCAAYIIERRESNPITEGHRHNVIFAVAKQLLDWREIDDDEALDWLRQLGESMEPPLGPSEVRRAFLGAKRGSYTSTGCDDPLVAPFCDPSCPIANG